MQPCNSYQGIHVWLLSHLSPLYHGFSDNVHQCVYFGGIFSTFACAHKNNLLHGFESHEKILKTTLRKKKIKIKKPDTQTLFKKDCQDHADKFYSCLFIKCGLKLLNKIILLFFWWGTVDCSSWFSCNSAWSLPYCQWEVLYYPSWSWKHQSL